MAKNRLFYITAIAVLALFYIYCDSYVPLVILLVTIIFTVVSAVIAAFTARKITVGVLAVQPSTQIGENAAFAVRIQNNSKLSVSQVCVTLEFTTSFDKTVQRERAVSSVAGHCEQSIYLYGSANHCAVISCKIKKATVTDALGIIAFRPALAPKISCCVVMPVLSDDTPLYASAAALSPDSDTYSDTRRGDDSSQVYDVRDYVQGDDIRRIHHQLSSKRDSLIVKEYSRPIADKRVVLLETGLYDGDLDAFMQRVDSVLSAFLSLVRSVLRDECTLSVRWYSEKHGEMFSYDLQQEDDVCPLVREYLSDSFSDKRDVSLTADCESLSDSDYPFLPDEPRGWYVYSSGYSTYSGDTARTETAQQSSRYIFVDAQCVDE